MRLNGQYRGRTARSVILLGLVALVSVALVSVARVEAAAGVPAGTTEVPIVWQHHQVKFSYLGLTTLYECDALQSQVGRILKYFGARADLQVRASCSQPVLPTGHAVINADFYSPVLAGGAVADTGTGYWAAVSLESGHPNFIEAGDCELVEDMKDLITGSFSLRNLDYSTSCFPHDLTLHDFGVKGEALKVAP